MSMPMLMDAMWAIRPQALEPLVDVLAGPGAGPRGAPGRSARGPGRRPAYRVVNDDVAVVRVLGVIVKHGRDAARLWGEATSIDAIADGLRRGLAAPGIRAVVLHIESPGGVTAGVAELAGEIVAAGSKKPVTAYADDIATGGAYWLGSQAGAFYGSRAAAVGSIGIAAVVRDTSRRAERLGIRYHVIRSGRYKAVGVPGVPIGAGDLADIERRVEAVAGLFAADVARGRRMGQAAVDELRDGRTVIGPDAVAAGLLDGERSLGQVLASATAGAPARPTPAPGAARGADVGAGGISATAAEAYIAQVAREAAARVRAEMRASYAARIPQRPGGPGHG